MSYDGDTALCALELELEFLKRKPLATSSSNVYSSSSNSSSSNDHNNDHNYLTARAEENKEMKLFIPPTGVVSSRVSDMPNKRARGEFTSISAKDENAINYSNHHSSSRISSSSSSSMKGFTGKRRPPQLDWQQISPSMRLHGDFMASDIYNSSSNNNNLPQSSRREEEGGTRYFQLQQAEESQIVIYADIPGKFL